MFEGGLAQDTNVEQDKMKWSDDIFTLQGQNQLCRDIVMFYDLYLAPKLRSRRGDYDHLSNLVRTIRYNIPGCHLEAAYTICIDLLCCWLNMKKIHA